MKIINRVKTKQDVLFFIWQLPQNLLGMLMIQLTKAWYSVAWKDCYFTKRISGFIPLGDFILVSDSLYNNVPVLKGTKEFQKLSRKYGWLYLVILFIKTQNQEKTK